MARTTSSDVLIPEIFTDAVKAKFAQKNVFAGSMLVGTKAAVVSGSFPGGAKEIGNQVEVPYFGTLGDFANNPDGTAVTPGKIGQTSEKATVTRDSLAFEVTRWGRNAKGGDAYEEAAQQIVDAAQRAMDKRLIDASVASGGLIKSAYSSSAPRLLDYDLAVDAKMLWGDEQENAVAMVVHSKTLADLYKMRDSVGRPLLTIPGDGELPRFMGLPVGASDRLPLTGSAMGSVTAAGSSPPTVTLAGTPLGAWDLKIVTTLIGALGTTKVKFSVDGGNNYSAEMVVPGSGILPLIDTAVDSLVGVNGATGITATFGGSTTNLDNAWTAKASLKVRTLLLKEGSLGFWFNEQALSLLTDDDILVDSSIGAMHLYAAAIRYRRHRAGTKPGVVVIEHNVSGY